MDSEKVIIEIIKPLLKDYLAFTKGQVPKDWGNVRDERQAYIERLQREINELKEDIKKAEEFNEDIEKNAMPSLKVRKPGMVDELDADIKENKEKIETYQKKIEEDEGELNRTKEELAQANAQIERRRQAKIAKIKHEIRDTIRQEIEAKEATGVEQEKLATLRKYEDIIDEDIQNLATMVEKEEENKLRIAKIEELKLELEQREKNCKDLLTEDYNSTKEEYIRNLETINIKELEQIKSITIQAIYMQVAQKANDNDKKESVYDILKKIENREKIITTNKISEIITELERKEKNCEDLLTKEYYATKEEYIKSLETTSIEKLEKIESVTIGTIYIQAIEKAMKKNNKDKANFLLDVMETIENRKEILRRNMLAGGENQIQEKNIFLTKIQSTIEGLRKIPTKATKTIRNMRIGIKSWASNTVIRIGNWALGMKVLGSGNENVFMNEEQIQESMKKNEEKHEQFIKDSRLKRQSEQSVEEQSTKLQENKNNENREEVSIQEQLKAAQAANNIEEVDYLQRMMQKTSQVALNIDEERLAAYRRANNIASNSTDRQEEKASRQIKIEKMPQFIKDYGAKKSKEESLDAKISEEKPRKTTWVKRLFRKAKTENTPVIIPRSSNQSVNSYAQGLKVGSPSQEEQSEHAKAFQQSVDENKKEINIKDVILGGE